MLLAAEDPDRAVPSGKILFSFGIVAHDARLSFGPALEAHFRHGQHAARIFEAQQSYVEFPAPDIAFGEPVATESGGAIRRPLQDLAAAHHRAVIKAQRGILQRRLDDPAPAI